MQVQAWMGHVDAKTTMGYLHRKSHENEAELLADDFRPPRAAAGDFALGDAGTTA